MTKWRTYGSPSPQMWHSIIEQAGGPPMLAHPDALAAAGEHGWLALAMLKAESSYGTHFNLNKKENKNPLNLRPPLRPDGTREPGDYMAFPLYPDAIRAWHYRITNPTYGGGIYARTETIADLVHEYAPSSDNNNEAAYVATIETLFDQWGVTPKETPMPTIVAKECPIETYVQWSGPNRPGLVMNSPSKIVTHEVGNKAPGANEDMHRKFVLSGGGPSAVSFHFVVGPTKIVQLLYLDENAWHASDGYQGDGNRDAWGIEHIQIGDFDKTMQHAAWLQAELVRNPRRFAIKNPPAFKPDITPANVRDRMVRHYDEAPDKKWCPEQIMNRGLWEPLKNAVVVELGNGSAPPKPVYVEPVGWPSKRGDTGIIQVGEAKARLITCEVECIKPNGTIPRAYASSKAGQSSPKIELGKKVTVIATVTVPAGQRTAQWHVLSTFDRVGAAGFLPKLPPA
jgi:hypothetical protein